MTQNTEYRPVRYRIGIDVGTHSSGFAAIEVDEQNNPLRILRSVVFKHDSGIDPGGNKSATTRLATSGVARRTRRRVLRNKRRLQELDAYLESSGFPLIDNAEVKDSRAPWRTRARLAKERLTDEQHRNEAFSIAIRHIARHRGWRSPYAHERSLIAATEPSDKRKALNARISDALGVPLPPDFTPAQLITAYLNSAETAKLRGPEGILGGTLHQSDYAQEILTIGRVQGFEEDFVQDLVKRVFHQKSPKGSAAGRVGKDALPGQGDKPRAEKAHPAFQRYRMVSVLMNLFIDDESGKRPLTPDERDVMIDFLTATSGGEPPTWEELAEQIGVERRHLRGTASEGPDGLPPSTRPPIDTTTQNVLKSKHKKLVAWWKNADQEHRESLVTALSNAETHEVQSEADAEVMDFLSTFTDAELEELDKVSLPSGRAAYSVDSLERLTRRMLADGCNLHEARKREFGVDDSWTPPAEAINARVGNPAVDRVLKQVARWIEGAETRWGTPLSVNIEHVRDALGSERASREYQAGLNKRRRANEKLIEEMHETLGLGGRVHSSDLTRYMAIQRQNGQCLYCGEMILYHTAEMDHIVPRSGLGSTNTRENLAAVCRTCNHQKTNMPFAVWAESCARPGVSLDEALARVRGMACDPGLNQKEFRRFQKSMSARLRSRHPDAEFDGRSLESVAWMAIELRHRIEQHYKRQGSAVDVRVYRGAVTAEARKASGFENRVNLIGSGGKTRLDRRHHAMDAVTIAMMTPGIAQSLGLRMQRRQAQRLTGAHQNWKTFFGGSPAAEKHWHEWAQRMISLSEMFNLLLTEDAIPVVQNLRLRYGSSAVHEDTVRPFTTASTFRVGDAIPAPIVDRASTPALWTALTRHPDFVEGEGLPENPERRIRIHDRWLGADEEIFFFPSGAASIAVRGGYCELGAGFHHARIYRIDGKKPSYAMLRVYQVDLAKHQKEDLFAVDLPLSSISVRTAPDKLRKALAAGTATYITWVVVGDELMIDPTAFSSGIIKTFFDTFPMITRWELAGFYDVGRFRLRPLILASEGVTEDTPKEVLKVLDMPGWTPAVDKLLKTGKVHVIRRSTLGETRHDHARSLPVSHRLG